ncbi:MAG TPA: hypothetical protein VMZ01_06360 [Aestuariivirga sp.]|nr:hypothetical protein [Aestuariivirga sp.]
MDELSRAREKRLRRELHGPGGNSTPSVDALKRIQRLMKDALQTPVPAIFPVAGKRPFNHSKIGVFGMPDGAGYFVRYRDHPMG